MATLPPFAYWVDPDKVLAGRYPTSAADIVTLLTCDVTCFLDLTTGVEDLAPYEPHLQPAATHLGLPPNRIEYHRLSIADLGAPSRQGMIEILDLLDCKVAQGHRVYLHCHYGRGRTGTVVGCYLVRHGMTGADALRAIRLRRRHLDGPSPESAAQERLVREWRSGE